MSDSEPRPVSFVDTNIFVYAIGRDDPQRSGTAQRLLHELMAADALRTSTQVLAELFVTLTRKIRSPMAAADALEYMDQIAAWPVVVSDYGAVHEAGQLSAASKISFWDALVVVAASRAGAALLYSEDLNPGQNILGVQIVNPFR